MGYLDSLKIYLIGIFYGSFTPGYSGQLMRIPYLKEKTGEPFGKLFINTIIDTFVHSFSIYGMIIIGAFLMVGTIPELLPITIAWMVGFCLAVLYFSRKERGEKFFKTKHNHNLSCSTCHTDNPAAQGKHSETDKIIKPLAPAANEERFTDMKKVANWIKRNCNDVLDRECTVQEKGDVLTYLLTVKK